MLSSLRILFGLITLTLLFCACGDTDRSSMSENRRSAIIPTSNRPSAPDTPREAPEAKLIKQETQVKETAITPDYLMGKFDPTQHPLFAAIPASLSSSKMYMRQEALTAFEEMHDAAKKDGVRLIIISATRPFHHQKRIWEGKWTGKRQVDGKMLSPTVEDTAARATKILRWSSMPGTSRHHWGTDIDINDLNNSYFESGKGKKEYDWLVAHAADYGFCQVYSPQGEKRPYGYQEEKWHWSYLPIAQKLTRAYKDMIRDKDIKGFAGAESAPKIEVVERYVLGINPECK